ncbi:DUF6722 family protein, partial [uncultured Parabacteroides sp.]|uniref:DUF6722 family protein n=2 Tax=uncultured Parabacteroides sp. TaxID=512312 RepID=UPI002666968E
MKRKTVQVSVAPIIINEKLGDFFIDIAKLVFAGVVLSTLLDITSDKLLVLLLGIGATIGLMLLGFKLYKKGHSVNVFKNIKWHMKMLCSYHLICHFYYQFFLSDLKSSPFGHDVPE